MTNSAHHYVPSSPQPWPPPRPGSPSSWAAGRRSSLERPMNIGLYLAYWPWLTLDEQVELAVSPTSLRLDSVWVAEAWGQDAVSVLGLLAGQTERVALGSGLMQIPARQPTATAMAAATLDVMRGGRFRLGLGVSGPQVSEGWYGVPFARPLGARASTSRSCGAALAREGPLEYAGEQWTLPLPDGLGKPLKLLARPGAGAHPDLPRRVGPEAIEQAGAIADGWLPFMLDPDQLAAARARRASAGRASATSTSARGAAGGRGRPRRGARPGPAVAGLLPGGHGRHGARTSTSRRPTRNGPRRLRPRGAGALAGRRPRRRRGGAERRELIDAGGDRGHARRPRGARPRGVRRRRDDPAGAAHGPGQGRRRARPGGGGSPGWRLSPTRGPEGIPGSAPRRPVPGRRLRRSAARLAARPRARAAVRRGVRPVGPRGPRSTSSCATASARCRARCGATTGTRSARSRGAGRRRRRSWSPAAATTTRARATSSPSFSFARHRRCAWPARATCSPSSSGCARRCAPRGCSSRRSALRRPVAAAHDRRRHRRARQGARRRARRACAGAAGRAGSCGRSRRCRTATPRRAITRALQDLAALRGGRGDRRRARRRLARRPVRVLRRDAVPHGRAAARCR